MREECGLVKEGLCCEDGVSVEASTQETGRNC